MKSAIALLAVLVLAAASGLTVQADDHTYVTNESSRSIRATTSYIGGLGRSQFEDELITPGTTQGDEYTAFTGSVNVELWLNGSSAIHQNIQIDPDSSIVGLDNPDGSATVVIYLAQYGSLHQTTGGVLTTIS